MKKLPKTYLPTYLCESSDSCQICEGSDGSGSSDSSDGSEEKKIQKKLFSQKILFPPTTSFNTK